MFERADFERLAVLLAGIKGRFILSLNDVPEIRQMFSDFSIEEISVPYTLPGAGKTKLVTELLISNS